MVAKRFVPRAGFFWFAASIAILATCSKDNGPVNPAASDTTAPAAVADLVAVDPTMSSVALEWTAPGDDGTTGTAAQYDVRYSTSAITEANWASASQVSGEPSPKAPGGHERLVVTYLSPGVVYYFAVKTADEKPNWSALSNVASDTTRSMPDTTPPAAVTDLVAANPTAHSVTLTWTAPGDDGNTGTAAYYDIRYSIVPITDANWSSSNSTAATPRPKPAGDAESFQVTGLGDRTRYYFAVRTGDEQSNWSPISNGTDATTLTATSGWSTLDGGMHAGGGPPAVVSQIIYDGRLIVGGNFDRAGSVPANLIAAWDGSSWSDISSGRGNGAPPVGLGLFQGRLFTGNGPRYDGDSPVCVWDGSSWRSIGPGVNSIFAMREYHGVLVGGGSVDGNALLAWDGSSWSVLGPALTGRGPYGFAEVDALGLYGDELVVVGSFTNAGAALANSIALWNGSSWSSVGSGVDGGVLPSVMAFAIYGDRLIAGGAFTSAGGVASNNIAAWNGSGWSALGLGVTGADPTVVHAIAVYNDKLIVGGNFTYAGGVPCSNIAAWDGTSWSSLGSGVNGWVYTLGVYGGRLIVGGNFTTAGGYPAPYIATWTE